MHIGRSLRAKRLLAGLSQTQLAALVGISYQQLQKYEKGINRISAGHLYNFAQNLCCPPNSFFPGLDDSGGTSSNNTDHRVKRSAQMVKIFDGLDEHTQKMLVELARALANAA